MVLFLTIPLINAFAMLVAPRDGQTILWNHETIALLGLSTGCTWALGWALKNASDQVAPNIKEPMMLAMVVILIFGIDRMMAGDVLDRLSSLIPFPQYPVQVAVAPTPIPATAIPPTPQPIQTNNQAECDMESAMGAVGCAVNMLGGVTGPLLAGLIIFIGGATMARTFKEAMR